MLTLIGVQWVWWRYLVYRPPGKPGQMSGGPAGGGPRQLVVVGRPDVIVSSLAGSMAPGDADGPGHAARFDRPTGLALDADGSLYVADTGNHRIRKVSPAGDTTTV